MGQLKVLGHSMHNQPMIRVHRGKFKPCASITTDMVSYANYDDRFQAKYEVSLMKLAKSRSSFKRNMRSLGLRRATSRNPSKVSGSLLPTAAVVTCLPAAGSGVIRGRWRQAFGCSRELMISISGRKAPSTTKQSATSTTPF